MGRLGSRTTRLLATVTVCATAWAVTGCGESDDDPGKTGSAADATPTATTRVDDRRQGGSQEERVAGIVEGMYADLAAGDAAGVCSVMSTAAQRQIAQQVPGGATAPESKRSCGASISRFIQSAATSGVLERTAASVKDVTIEGDLATATVVLAGSAGRIRLERENGSWVFGPGSVTPGG